MISESSQIAKESKTYQFGEFHLDAENFLLLRNNETVQLPIKAVQILLALVEADGRVVKKEEILERVWADTFIEESNLSHHVAALRRALGEEKNSKKFIETIPRRGYRFVAPVTEIENGAAEITISERTRTRIAEEEEIEVSELQPIKSISAETTAPETSAAPTAKKTRRSRRSAVLAGTIAIITLAAIGFAFYKYFNPLPMTFEAKNLTRLTSSGKVRCVVISADGKFIIYSQEEMDGEQQSLWIKHIGSDSNAQIVAPAAINYRSLNISPDGNRLYYVNEKGTLFQMPVFGGAVKKVADGLFVGTNFNGIGISPDGRQIAFVRRSEKDASALFIADADGESERVLAAFEQPVRFNPFPAWSPDGKIIACPVLFSGRQNILALQVADGTSSPIFSQNWNTVKQMAWLPDSKNLLMWGDNDSDRGFWNIYYPTGEAVKINNDRSRQEGVSITSDGHFLATVKSERTAYIWMMPSDNTAGAKQLTAGTGKFDGGISLGWLPDGKVLFNSISGNKRSVLMIETNGGNPKPLVKDDFLAISPDGRFIVYQEPPNLSGGQALRLANVSDGEEKQLTKNAETKNVDVWAAFSPDGKWVVFTRFAKRVGLWKVSADGGEALPILIENAICPTVSPDGKTVAFVLRRAGQPNRIALVSFDGGEIIKIFDAKLERNPVGDKQNLQWTADGRGVYFVAYNNGVSNIWQQPIDGSPPVQVTDFKDGRIFNFAFSPDGKQPALSRGTFNSDVVLIENGR